MSKISKEEQKMIDDFKKEVKAGKLTKTQAAEILAEEHKKFKYEEKDLVCPNKKCLYSWQYFGKAAFYTSCPKCGWRVKVNQ